MPPVDDFANYLTLYKFSPQNCKKLVNSGDTVEIPFLVLLRNLKIFIPSESRKYYQHGGVDIKGNGPIFINIKVII